MIIVNTVDMPTSYPQYNAYDKNLILDLKFSRLLPETLHVHIQIESHNSLTVSCYVTCILVVSYMLYVINQLKMVQLCGFYTKLHM